MSIYNLIEYRDNYSQTSEKFRQYYTDESALIDAGTLDNFSGNSALLKNKQKITGSAGNDGTNVVKIMVP